MAPQKAKKQIAFTSYSFTREEAFSCTHQNCQMIAAKVHATASRPSAFSSHIALSSDADVQMRSTCSPCSGRGMMQN